MLPASFPSAVPARERSGIADVFGSRRLPGPLGDERDPLLDVPAEDEELRPDVPEALSLERRELPSALDGR
jgi:hypothetical protein